MCFIMFGYFSKANAIADVKGISVGLVTDFMCLINDLGNYVG